MSHRHLRKIPIDGYTYAKLKDEDYFFMNETMSNGKNAVIAASRIFYDVSEYMSEFGMEKFCHLLVCCLYNAEHNEKQLDYFYSLLIDIADIETGDYDVLFTAQELTLIKEDIRKVKAYILDHTEVRYEQ